LTSTEIAPSRLREPPVVASDVVSMNVEDSANAIPSVPAPEAWTVMVPPTSWPKSSTT